jgi:hypothetical protein
VISHQKDIERGACGLIVALRSSVLDRAAHAFDLTVDPGELTKSSDADRPAPPLAINDNNSIRFFALGLDKRGPVVGQDCMDF